MFNSWFSGEGAWKPLCEALVRYHGVNISTKADFSIPEDRNWRNMHDWLCRESAPACHVARHSSPQSRIYPKLEIDSGMEFTDHMMETSSISTSFFTQPIFVVIKLQGFWIIPCNYLEWNNSLLLVKNRVKWLQNQGEPKGDGIPPNTTENPKMTSAWKDFT